MKKFKSAIALLLVAVMMLSFAACTGKNNTEPTTNAETTTQPESTQAVPESEQVKVASINGPTGMGMVKMMDSNRYKFTKVSNPTEIVALISTGAVDIAACPLNLAANLYKKTNGNIKILGLNTLGVLYVVTNGVTINSINDLKGKTIYSTGEGATPEYIINYILEKNGIKNDVKVEYLSEHSELAAKVAAGEAQIAVLPEPFVSVATSKNSEVKATLSLTEEWSKVAPDTSLVMGCVIARKDFAEKNPEAVKKFIADNKASVEYVNTAPVEASDLIVNNGILDAAVFSIDNNLSGNKAKTAKLQKASGVITRCNIVFIDGEKMRTDAEANFKVYFDADPKSVGGAVPSSDVYYAAE